jgi:hypothetical protein
MGIYFYINGCYIHEVMLLKYIFEFVRIPAVLKINT